MSAPERVCGVNLCHALSVAVKQNCPYCPQKSAVGPKIVSASMAWEKVMTFIRNQWYTAATSTEVGAKPLARTICNEPLAIFRGQDGTAAVLTDRCPHRKAPLSAGEVVGNDIQCGYHG